MLTTAENHEPDDARFWNRAARKYANSTIKDLTGYERTLIRTREFLDPSATVLELGCGTGNTALKLAPSVGHITGTDISREMIAIANERKAAGSCHNVTFTAAGAQTVNRPEEHFDAVLAFNLLHLIADRPALFHHVSRLLKPGGVFITKTPCLSEMNPVIRFAIPLMKRIGSAPSLSFFKGEELLLEVAASGFSILDEARHGSGKKDFRIFIAARQIDPI